MSSALAHLLKPIIIDNGSSSIKAGIAGNTLPTSVFPAIIGRPERTGLLTGMGQKDAYIGVEALAKKGILELSHPVNRGIVTSWEDMELVWHHAFYHQLKVAPEEHPLLLTEPPLNPRANRELMAETMFETFYSPALYVIIQAAPALYASGRTSGLVVDIGDGLSYSVPFIEGSAILSATKRLELGGRDLTNYLASLMAAKGYSFASSSSLEMIRDVKEKLCETARDKMVDGAGTFGIEEEAYTLPDGNQIKLSVEREKCPEALFQPELLGLEYEGIHKLAQSSIMKCGVDVRKALYENVFLVGGSTLFPGFVRRFEDDLSSVLPAGLNVRVFAGRNRQYSVWTGGSILASMSTFQSMWITRKEYDEVGSVVVSRKCF